MQSTTHALHRYPKLPIKMAIIILCFKVLLAIISLLLIAALLMKKEHFVRSEIIINAPSQKVFDYIKLIQNQENFNKNAMVDPNRIRVLKGTDGTVGYIYAWSGNKDAGEGEKEIMNILEGRKVEMEIRFIKPMKAIGRIIMETEPTTTNQTRLSWSNSGTLAYPLNFLIPMVQKHVTKDMAISLKTLKDILEK